MDLLDPSERKELLKNVFSDERWYDGMAFHEAALPIPLRRNREPSGRRTVDHQELPSHGSRLAFRC